MKTLFDECLEVLGKNKKVLTECKTSQVFKSFMSTYPITKWGVIDWSAVDNKFIVGKIGDIKHIIETHKPNADYTIYILWNDSSLPSIKSDLDNILNVIDDITAVSFDTWIYSEKEKYVIEFYHDGKITIGFK